MNLELARALLRLDQEELADWLRGVIDLYQMMVTLDLERPLAARRLAVEDALDGLRVFVESEDQKERST